MKTKTLIGLRTRIETATSVEAIKKLLKEGETYEAASPATIRSWQKAALVRSRLLGDRGADQANSSLQAEEDDEQVKPKTKKALVKKKLVAV